MAPLITLLTDFGYVDGFVGILKGVIAGICPHSNLIDLTHNIPPYDVAAARFTLMNACAYFPPGTIHLVVVDPGVGTQRRAIALQTSQGYLVGPDNGIFSGVMERMGAVAAVSLTNPRYWRTPHPSSTFHGRDVFAPVAAHLAAGVPLSDLGDAIALDSLVQIIIPPLQMTQDGAIGHIQYIDHFGNLITTLPASTANQQDWQMQAGKISIPSGNTYGDVESGHLVALVGSHGWIEIAVNGGSAYERLRLSIGDEVQLQIQP